MELLPDDVLLVVMQHLDLPSLFACRQVCKRLEGLALHPDLWQHRRIYGHGATMKCPRGPICYMCPALRLAPRLNEVCFGVPRTRSLHKLYTQTNCAVSKLELRLQSKLGSGASIAARVIRRQGQLGRLRELKLDLGSPSPKFGLTTGSGAWSTAANDLRLLFEQYFALTPGLESLVVSGPGEAPAEHFFPRTTAIALLKVMPLLPALQSLVVPGALPDAFLLGITPETAPALRTLSMRSSACVHQLMHCDAVQKLHSRNPLLQLIDHLPKYCFFWGTHLPLCCEACSKGCHADLRTPLFWVPSKMVIPRSL